MDDPAVLLFHNVPVPVVQALAEQGVAAPGYQVQHMATALERVHLVLTGAADGLPAQMKAWRAQGLRAPVLLLGQGAEDWEVTESLPLPLRLGALMARLRYYVALARQQGPAIIACGSYALDVAQRLLCLGDAVQALTEKECALLQTLAAGAMTREALLRDIWGYEADLDTHTLETHIYRLRRKLAELGGGDIMTTPEGYRLSCP